MTSLLDIFIENEPSISSYLCCKDMKSLSQVNQNLRNIYHPKAYCTTYVLLEQSTFPGNENDTYNGTMVPLDTFKDPASYSWFPKNHVKKVHFLGFSTSLTSNEFPYSSIMDIYPELKSLTMKDIPLTITLTNMFVDQLLFEPSTNCNALSFTNLVPFLNALKNEPSIPVAMLFSFESLGISEDELSREDDIFLQLLQLMQNRPNIVAKSEGISLRQKSYPKPTLLGNNLNEAIEDEHQFRSLIPLAESILLQNLDLATDGKYSSKLCLFPKPSWTDFLTDLQLTISRETLGIVQSNFKTSKLFKLYQLNSYPNLKKVSIYNSGENTFHFSAAIYKSLMKCEKLDYLIIRYRGLPNYLKGRSETIKLINQLRGNWKSFELEIMSNIFNWSIEKLDNPTITGFKCSDLNQNDDFDALIFNTIVFESLDLQFTKMYEGLPNCFNLLKTHQNNLKKLSIEIYLSNYRIFTWATFYEIFHNTTFPKVTEFTFSYKKEYTRDYECLFEICKPIVDYLIDFFSIVNFGEPIETYEQAVLIWYNLVIKAESSTDKKSFSKEKFEFGRYLPIFDTFFKCHDHKIWRKGECCHQNLGPSTVTSLYCFFAYCFGQIISVNEIQEPHQFDKFLKKSIFWDNFFAAITESFPSLERLHVASEIELKELAIMPYFQRFLRKSTSLTDLGFSNTARDYLKFPRENFELDWSDIISPTYEYQDEWIRKTFQNYSRYGANYTAFRTEINNY